MRHDRVGCQLYPGSGGIHTTVEESSVAACRFATARSLSSPPARPDAGSAVTRHPQWFTDIHPFGLPLTCNTRPERAPLSFSLGFAPGHYWPRTPGRGPVQDTDRSHVFDIKVEPPIDGLLTTVRSARGAVPAFQPVRFPEPPPEPGVPVSQAPGSPQAPEGFLLVLPRCWATATVSSFLGRGNAWCAPWPGRTGSRRR